MCRPCNSRMRFRPHILEMASTAPGLNQLIALRLSAFFQHLGNLQIFIEPYQTGTQLLMLFNGQVSFVAKPMSCDQDSRSGSGIGVSRQNAEPYVHGRAQIGASLFVFAAQRRVCPIKRSQNSLGLRVELAAVFMHMGAQHGQGPF